ncbi:HAD family hydrolase [Nocardia sp. CA-129566]|uniref:HAD family hydrolase n=1 Tax=Nocardia sp. CA-129566 TaxID=3239976 RepID=UPI003D993688
MSTLGTLDRVAIEAVLFDFSGTLFRLEPDETWDGMVGLDGEPLDQVTILERMTRPVGAGARFDAAGRIAWERRDLDPAMHRTAYFEVLRQAGVPTPTLIERFYDRVLDPMSWTPYPDTGAVLKTLAAQDIPVAVVSNIAFDIRPAFAANGWDRLIAAHTLSFEVGAVKPDPRIFLAALDQLGVRPESALMVGDSAEADGGAVAAGCAFALVDPVPTADRAEGLLDVLRQYELT